MQHPFLCIDATKKRVYYRDTSFICNRAKRQSSRVKICNNIRLDAQLKGKCFVMVFKIWWGFFGTTATNSQCKAVCAFNDHSGIPRNEKVGEKQCMICTKDAPAV